MNVTRARRPKIRSRVATLMSMFMLAGLMTVVAPSAPTSAAASAQDEMLPIIFVHGFSGSGAQFESQAMRFASNGWPAERVRAFDYNTAGSGGGTQSSDLDAFVDDVLAEFGVDQAHFAGHSMGTAVMSGYLGDSAQAAKVATYASLDGLPASCTGGPRCVTITAASMGQTHVEAATSPEAFARMYENITGEQPATTDIVAEDGPIEIAGRAVDFPANTGVEGGTLEIYETEWETGHRVGDTPVESVTLDSTGDWGPVEIDPSSTYEFALTRDETTIHYYKQRFPRSDYIVRLNATPADSDSAQNTNRGPDHVTSTIVRYQEWWTTHQSGNNDILAIYSRNADGQVVEEPVAAIEQVTANNVVGFHIHDDEATPGSSSLGLLPWFGTQAFQSGTDVYMPAEPGGEGITSFVVAPRGQTEMNYWQVVNTPNWPSDEHHVIVEFNDYVQ